MLQQNNDLIMSVDTLLHLHDLNRYQKPDTSAGVALQLGARFVHTFFDVPIKHKCTIKNHNYLTRLKMLNIQL